MTSARLSTCSVTRLDRLMLWSRLWLLRLARWSLQAAGAWAPLDKAVQRSLAPKIKWLGKFILALIVFKARLRAMAAYVAQCKKTGAPYGPKPRAAKHHARRLFGARLRKLRTPKADLRAPMSPVSRAASPVASTAARAARRARRLSWKLWVLRRACRLTTRIRLKAALSF